MSARFRSAPPDTQPTRGPGDVRIHRAFRRRCVAVADCPDNPEVFLVCYGQQILGAVDPPGRAGGILQPRGQVVDDGRQIGVPGRPAQRAVKCRVSLEPLFVKGALAVHEVHGGIHAGEIPGVAADRGQSGGTDFQNAPQFKQIEEVVAVFQRLQVDAEGFALGRVTDKRTSTLARFDHAIGPQPGDGFANHVAADAKPGRECALGRQDAAGFDFPAGDAPQNFGGNPVGEAFPLSDLFEPCQGTLQQGDDCLQNLAPQDRCCLPSLSCYTVVGQAGAPQGMTHTTSNPKHSADRDRFIAALRAVAGADHVIDGGPEMAPFIRDWPGDYLSTPLAVVLPASTAEVSATVACCAEHGLKIIPQGGHTGLVGGTYTTDSERTIVLNLRRMNAVRRVDAANYSITVEAGCIVETVQNIAAEHGRLFPLSFGAQGSAMIGGALSTNAGGLNVLRYGMARDLTLGLEVVLADGTVINALSGLRKDNTGISLSQIFVGSEGTLGIITAASLKLFPAVRERECAFLALPSLQAVVPLYELARTECCDLLTAFELIPRNCLDLALQHKPDIRDPLSGRYGTHVLMELTSSGAVGLRGIVERFFEHALEQELVLDGVVSESVAQTRALWSIREAMVEAQAAQGRHVRTDISVPIPDVPGFISSAEAALNDAMPGWTVLSYGHVGDGNVHMNALPPKTLSKTEYPAAAREMLRIIHADLARYGGSVSAEHGVGRSKRAEVHARKPAASLALAAAMKHTLDPSNMLNPGCFF